MDGMLARTFLNPDRHLLLPPIRPVVLVVGSESEPGRQTALDMICDFLDIAVEHAPSAGDVAYLLRQFRPAAAVVQADCGDRDGFDVMLEIGRYDPALPTLILTGEDDALMGAADAMAEIAHLEAALVATRMPAPKDIVDFLFRAGRHVRIGGLIPV